MSQAILFILVSFILLAVVPISFAYDNQTTILYDDNGYSSDAIVKADADNGYRDVYFNANAPNDNGNGTINNPYQKLTAGRIVNNANLHLANGVYNYTGRKTFSNITIQGELTDNTIVSGGYLINNEFFKASNLTFINTDISNNHNMVVRNVLFKDYNQRQIHSSNGSLSVFNCSFTNGSNVNGAILYTKDTILNISDSNFKYCNASIGAGVCSLNSRVNITNSVFEYNHATCMGGGLTLINSSSNIYNLSFTNNTAVFNGGAIYLFDGTANITDSIFLYNEASIASCIYADDISPLKIKSNTFKNNTAYKYASVHIISSEDCNIDDNIFTDNVYVVDEIINNPTADMDIGNGNVSLYQYTPVDDIVLPDSYDLRDYNQVTPIKDQGSDGNCWAFAALASLESCILKASGVAYDLSENNMKNLIAVYSDYGWAWYPNTGGNFYMSNAYLNSWLGPVNETDDPYTISSIISPILDSIIHVQDIIFIRRSNNTDNNPIKEALIRYGAVASDIYWDFSYGKGANYYYNGQAATNHAVAIIGWNDSYSRDNFKVTPPGDGAWIVKNSWGTSGSDDGYYYISYYDTTHALQEDSITYLLNDSINYDHNYQYDFGGYTDYFLNNSNTVYYKNCYTARSDEYIEAVSTYFNENTDYTIRVYVNDDLRHTQDGSSSYGYYTIKLNNHIAVKKDDNFTVEFKITTENDAGVPISENITTYNYFYRENVSFISYDGIHWQDLYNLSWQYSNHIYYSQTAALKAFTTNKVAHIKVEATNINNCMIKAYVYDQYNNHIENGTVTIMINEETITLNNTNGTVIITKELTLGENNITAIFTNKDTNSCNDTTTITVTTNSITTVETNITGHMLSIHANITDVNNYIVNKGKVVFKINGKTLKDEDGKIIYVKVVNSTASMTYYIPDSLDNKTINISVVYSGASYISSSRNTTTTTIHIIDDTILNILEPKETVKANTNTTISVQITGYAKGKIVFKLSGKTLKDENGKVIYLTPDENSIASLTYNFGNIKAQNYTLTAVLLTNNKRIETNTTINVIK